MGGLKMANEYWAVEGDPNNHGNGQLIANLDSSPRTVKINNLYVIVVESEAEPDDFGHIVPDVNAITGSGTVKCYGKPVHRQSDERRCGAITIAKGQKTVLVGD
jgi:uncharacterized Zn-binding protein involved in type VI secretion